jgi:hypothetical protein
MVCSYEIQYSLVGIHAEDVFDDLIIEERLQISKPQVF